MTSKMFLVICCDDENRNLKGSFLATKLLVEILTIAIILTIRANPIITNTTKR